MTTEEKNKNIAIFMKAKFSNYSDGSKGVIFNSNINPEGYLPVMGIKGLKYHKSWNWIMPVVHKCKSLVEEHLDFDTEEYEEFEEEIFNLDNMMSEFLSNDIDAIFERVVKFIEWWETIEI